MSVALGLSLAFILFYAVALGAVASKMWHGDVKAARSLELGLSILPVRSDVRRGAVRGIVPLLLSLVFAMITLVLMVIAMETWSGGSKFTPWTFTAWSALGAVLMFWVLHLCVIFFNRPRLLVPPSLKDDPGVFAGRRPVPDDVAEAFAAEADRRARQVGRQRR